MVISVKMLEKKFDTRGVNNGILSGLVAVTSGAPLVDPEGAFVIGVVSAFFYYASANLLLKLKIDDVVDAVGAVYCKPVFFFFGITIAHIRIVLDFFRTCAGYFSASAFSMHVFG